MSDVVNAVDRDRFIIKYSSKKGYDNAKTVYIRVADTKLNQHKIIINKSRENFTKDLFFLILSANIPSQRRK